MMSDFGDYEPEDAWDVDDDADDMARNLARRLDLLDMSTQSRSIEDVIGELEHRLVPYRRQRDQLRPRDLLRLDQLIEDLDVLRDRARRG
jgi:hypothetical protein